MAKIPRFHLTLLLYASRCPRVAGDRGTPGSFGCLEERREGGAGRDDAVRCGVRCDVRGAVRGGAGLLCCGHGCSRALLLSGRGGGAGAEPIPSRLLRGMLRRLCTLSSGMPEHQRGVRPRSSPRGEAGEAAAGLRPRPPPAPPPPPPPPAPGGDPAASGRARGGSPTRWLLD